VKMKTLVVTLIILVSFVACASATEPALDPKITSVVNNHPNRTWTATLNNKFANMTLDQVRSLLGAQVPKYVRYNEKQMEMIAKYAPKSNNPTEFDARTAWPGCIHPIRDQGQCGSCWAFAGSEAFSDRFCIASKGKINMVFSPQDMVSCNWYNFGCNGGQLLLAWEYMKHTGLVPDKCFPYSSGNGTVADCPSVCADGKTDFLFSKYKMASISKYSPTFEFWKREVALEDALIAGGPIETGFSVYQDFLQYSKGVYQYTTGAFLGGHAVKIVGYGVDSVTGLKYWIVANSWGTDWGMSGYFWIRKGNNECGFEADAYGGEPDLVIARGEKGIFFD
jgi:cathepsin B